MRRPFIPNRDGDFDQWLANFAAKISADPAAYGLSPADAAQMDAARALWHSAYLGAVAPVTRTLPAIAEKDSRRAAAVVIARRLAARVRSDDTVPNTLKLGLGLKVRAAGLTRAPAPAALPVLSVDRISPTTHDLVVRSAQENFARAKPKDAATLLVVRVVADAPAKNPHDGAFLTLATRMRFRSEFEHQEGGKIATYFARWANPRGELGPWSSPVSARVAA
jgi:hypothetical protein